MFVGEDGDLNPVTQPQLGEGAGDVALDGRLAEVEPGGDLGVRQALGHQPDDVQLPLAEPPAGAARTAPVSCSRLVSLSRKPLAPAFSAW